MGIHCRIWFFVLFVLYCLAAAGLDCWRAWKIGNDARDVTQSLRHLLVNSMLPPMWWLFLVISYLVPVFYVLFPPTVPDRDEVMNFDPQTGVGRPKHKEIKQVWGFLTLVREVCWGLTVAYCTVLLVEMFIY